jgi:hypothetical protein
MRRYFIILSAICVLSIHSSPVWAASRDALKLRALYGLGEFTPPEVFLNGNFVADELEPQYVFGKVKDFEKSRSCPASWLIEDNERNRIKARQDQPEALEYTLYLEEDCPGKVAYYVFIDRSLAKSTKWLDWRRNFHKSKTEEQFSAVSAVLEQAARGGFPVDAELRFIEIGGELVSKRPEDFLKSDLKIKPIYDLKKQ